MLALSVIIATRNPHRARLLRTLAGVRAQTLAPDRWETIIIDNASTPALGVEPVVAEIPLNLRTVQEREIGLTPARLRGIAEAEGEILVFVDDDNVLSPDYLADVVRVFAAQPKLGAAGGPVVAEFEETPAEWTREFWGLLALHEHGPAPLLARADPAATWPPFAPVGAGLCVRRAAAARYVAEVGATARRKLDRSGSSLASGGDNDLVLTALHGGWDVGYFPELHVTHLIPPHRLEGDYLARLNEGIQRTWVRVLALHGQCPWPPVAPWTVPLRVLRSWWREKAWTSTANRVRWKGCAGRLRGQGDIFRS